MFHIWAQYFEMARKPMIFFIIELKYPYTE